MKISVIIPAYNVEKYIERSINSALNQIFKPFEIIVIDDGSTDNTVEIVKKYYDKVRYIYQTNQGASSARNNGIVKAKGDWIAFLDSDDQWVNTHLENFVETFKIYPEMKWYGAPFKMLEEKSKKEVFKVNSHHLREKNKHTMFDDYMSAFPPQAYLSSPTMVINKSVFEEVGDFDINKKVAEDIDLWFRIGLKFPNIGYSYEEAAIVFRRQDSLSNSNNNSPELSIKRFINSEKLAEGISANTLKRAEPRIIYWVIKLLRSSISKNDTKSLKKIKKSYYHRLSIKYKIILLLGIHSPFVFHFVKSFRK